MSSSFSVLQNIQSSRNYDECIDVCSLNDMKAIIETIGIRLARTFTDVLNADNVDKFNSLLTRAEKIKLSAYMKDKKSQSRVTPADLMSHKQPAHQSVTLGNNQFKFDDAPLVNCKGAVVGMVNPPMFLASVAETTIKYTEKKRKNTLVNLTYSSENVFAPSPQLCTAVQVMLSGVVTEKPTYTQLVQKFEKIPGNEKQAVAEYINPHIPTVHKGSDVPMAKINVQAEKWALSVSQPPPTSYELCAEYSEAVAYLSIFSAGTGTPAFQRVSYSAYTGTPNVSVPCADVITLSDAGVKPGSAILVKSSDSNLVSLLRANFGEKVFGIGNNSHIMKQDFELSTYEWDYVYYPKPILFSKGPSAEESLRLYSGRIMSKLLNVSGCPLMYLSPVIFYCRELREAVGCSVSQPQMPSSKLAKTDFPIHGDFDPEIVKGDVSRILLKYDEYVSKMNLMVSEDETKKTAVMRDCDKNTYNVTFFEEYLEVKDKKLADFLLRNTLHIRLSRVKSFTVVPYAELSHFKFSAVTSIKSHVGNLLIGANKEQYLYQLMGHVVGHMKECFKAIYFSTALSTAKYKINFIKPNQLDDIGFFDDKYSAMYSTEIIESFEKKNEEQLISVGLSLPIVSTSPSTQTTTSSAPINSTSTFQVFDSEFT